MTETFNGFIPIDDHGLLLVQGPDAKTFLQGQVTCDIKPLQAGMNGTSTLGAHCTPKGRMLFSFRAFALADEMIALIIVKSLLADAKAALEKYSVFSKVEIIDASSDYQILGFKDSAAISDMGFTLPATANATVSNPQGTIIAISDNCYEYILDNASSEQLLLNYPASHEQGLWDYEKILAGLGEVRPETVDMLIPQMLNYQAVGTGVSFQKGCYTGQEVVARMQYLGKLKRRLFRFSTSSKHEATTGMPLYTQNNEQSVGNVVLASSYHTAGQIQLLAVATEDAVDKNSVYLDKDSTQKLQPESLPYAIPKE